MSFTLLEVVQDMLYSIQGDQVSDINGTVEAIRCHYLARQVFLDSVANTSMAPEQNQIKQLEGVGEVDDPTKLSIPRIIDEILCLEYQESDGDYKELQFLEPHHFTAKCESYRGLDNTKTVTYGDINLVVRTDKHPKYWTTYDNQFVLFDSWQESVEASVVGTKTRCLVRLSGPELWNPSNDFVIPLSDDAMSTYLNECKDRAWSEIKQQPNPSVTRAARRERAKLHRNARVKKKVFTDLYPDYGRP